MDPRWGSSGKRIEFTLDVKFCRIPANSAISAKMVRDNFGGKSSGVFVLDSAPSARLRGGFDRMKCVGGGYRIDRDRRGATMRFFVETDGTRENGSSYGYVPDEYHHYFIS